jgi:phosphatidylglycerol:prolipoprotein diacylglycerol transferase
MLPVLFKIGSFPIHTYGVVMIVAFLAGLYVARKRAPIYGLDANKISDMAFLTLIIGVLGARIAFFIQEPPKDPREYFSLQFAGLTSFGGLVGGALVVLLWARKTKTALRPLLDVMGPPVLIGWAIGRVGCLLNGCCFGGVCSPSFPLGIHVPGNELLHHPAQIYDSLMNLAGFAVALWLERKRVLQLGQLFAVALMLHGLSRFVYEFWRAGTEDQVRQGIASSTYWGGLPITQAHAVAILIILFGGVLFALYRRAPERAEPSEPPTLMHKDDPEPLQA